MFLRPVKVHNLLISKNVLVSCNISNPALYHQLHDPEHTTSAINMLSSAASKQHYNM